MLTLAMLVGIGLMTACSSLAGTGRITTGIMRSQQKMDIRKEPSLKPNESGKIMVLMYHNIGSSEKSWVRTPENFTKDLETLYEKGYRPISLQDYVNGHITTPSGYTPVVITFDDGNENNFEYLSDGSISKTCAVGLLLSFHEKHPDFPLEATFFLTGEAPFGQKDLVGKKLNFLVDNGMDVGNHTKDHLNLNSLTKEQLQMEISLQKAFLEKILADKGYEVNTFAKPFGTRPLNDSFVQSLETGSYSGVAYNNIAVLNVGANPGYSPFDRRFRSGNIPRVKASEFTADHSGINDFLKYFDEHPGERFVSDGLSNIITVPADKASLIRSDSGKLLQTY
jgi:peptidoglycan/xylan/chitin deacetylase (PgdA/CDA1 family)